MKPVEKIEELESLDPVARLVQKLVARVVPQQTARKDVLSGTWLGRPVHPALTDVVIGSWLSATFLDLLHDERTERAADRLVDIGNLAALPTFAAGLSDWADLWGDAQRVGSVHGLGNLVALSLQVLSSKRRTEGRRAAAKALSLTAVGVAAASAYLGGHLSFVRGVGVNHTAFEGWPQEWTPVMRDEDLGDETLTQVSANDVRIALYKVRGEIFALADRCTHRGCPLHLGQVHGATLECPCHGSIFRLADGAVLRGPATVAAPSFEVRRRDGLIELRRPVGTQWGRRPGD